MATRRLGRRWSVLTALVAVALFMAGCGGPIGPSPNTLDDANFHARGGLRLILAVTCTQTSPDCAAASAMTQAVTIVSARIRVGLGITNAFVQSEQGTQMLVE